MNDIVIVDYGMANLRSVQKAFEKFGQHAVITGDPNRVGEAAKLVLPGVGAFRDAIARLHEAGLAKPIRELKQMYPQARGLRSHSLFFTERFRPLYEEFGMTYDANAIGYGYCNSNRHGNIYADSNSYLHTDCDSHRHCYSYGNIYADCNSNRYCHSKRHCNSDCYGYTSGYGNACGKPYTDADRPANDPHGVPGIQHLRRFGKYLRNSYQDVRLICS